MVITKNKIKIMCYCHLEMSWALNREDEHDGVVCQEDSGEFGLIAWCGGPNTFLLRNFYISNVAALHNEVMCWGTAQRGNWFWDLLGVRKEIDKNNISLNFILIIYRWDYVCALTL